MKKFFVLILLFIIIYYAIKAFTRLLKLFVQKNDGNSGNGNFQNFHDVNTSTTTKKRFEKDEGEYVDYEEVK